MVSWTEAQINKGDMGADGGRLRITSLNAMAEMVAPDEPSDAVWVMENMDRLRERWARKNPSYKADTAQTYSTRAKTTIAAYIEWAAAPDKYDPRKVISKKAESGAAAKKRSTGNRPSPATPVQQADLPYAAPPRRQTRTFPLGDGGEIVFELPPEGVKFADVRKFAVHLMTLASDFDVSNAAQAQIFGIVVRGEK